MTHKSWLWPDHPISKRESRILREEHNALVNSHAELLDACKTVVKHHRDNDSGEGELFGLDFVTTCIAAIRNAEPEAPTNGRWTQKHRIESPDGLPIAMLDDNNEVIYDDYSQASLALDIWISRFKTQGYYKNGQCERIPYADIRDHCHIIPV